MLPLLQVEGKVYIEELWDITMEKVCFGCYAIMKTKNQKTNKDFGTLICELFVSPLQQILSLYATIQSASIKRT